MGRAPCCDKANVKRGPWSPEEDSKLKSYIQQHGTGGNWIALPQKIGLKRCGKSCRLRWLNYLRPNIKHGSFSEEEDHIICTLYLSIGSRWSIIAAQLPGRTDNDIKNYWNTRLKKKLLGKQRKEQHAKRGNANKESRYKMMTDSSSSSSPHPNKNLDLDLSPPMISYMNPTAASIYRSNLWPPASNDHELLPADPLLINPNQESLRNLLIKLGGRFSEQPTNGETGLLPLTSSDFQYPNFDMNPSLSLDQKPMMISTTAHCDHHHLFPNMPPISNVTNENYETTMNNFQEFETFLGVHHHELIINQMSVYNDRASNASASQMDQFDVGLVDPYNNSTSTPAESTSWGDQMMICNPAAVPPANSMAVSEDCRQEILLQKSARMRRNEGGFDDGAWW